MGNVSNTGLDVIGGGGHWHRDFAGKPSNGVSNVLSLGVAGPDSVASVRVQGRAKVPAIHTMGSPAAVHAGFFVDDDACTRGAMGVWLKSKGPNS